LLACPCLVPQQPQNVHVPPTFVQVYSILLHEYLEAEFD